MLVLSRKRNEQIYVTINDVLVKVTLVEIRGDKARIGIDAPLDFAIHRREVYEAIQRNNGAHEQSAEPQVVRAAPSSPPVDWSKKRCLGKGKGSRGALSKVTYGINRYEAVACEAHVEELKGLYPNLVEVEDLPSKGVASA